MSSEIVLNEVGDVLVTEPAMMLALADAERLATLERLRRLGPSTTAELSADLDIDEPVLDAQLRLLEGVGLITLDGETWQAVGKGIYFEIPDGPAAAQQAARKLNNVMFMAYEDLPRRWVAEDEPRLDLEWCQAAGLFNAGVVLTPQELRDIQDGMERLLEPYTSREPEQAPAGGSRVRILSYFLPQARSAGSPE